MQLLSAAVARPRQAGAMIMMLLRSPTVAVVLSDSDAGRHLRKYFDARFLGLFPQNRLCRGVLVLPQRPSQYLHGRRRQAVRTNVRRAAAAGISCETVASPSDALLATRQIVRRRHAPTTAEDLASLAGAWPELFKHAPVTLTIARDRAGTPLAAMAVVIDDDVCLIHMAVASSHEARWALHHHLAMTLIARGVTYLLSADGGPFGALGFPPEVQYYQHLQGYTVCHISPYGPLLASRGVGPYQRIKSAFYTSGAGRGVRRVVHAAARPRCAARNLGHAASRWTRRSRATTARPGASVVPIARPQAENTSRRVGPK